MKPGSFIVVEGLEGSGKSTAIATLKQYLSPLVEDLVLTREPGGTPVGETIRRLIKEEGALDPRCELLLFYAARVQLVEEVIRPALHQGSWVLADRFELSSFAYQGWGREVELKMINELSKFCLSSLKPDLIFYLDIPPEQGLMRIQQRGELDRMEQEDLAFFTRIRQGYHQLIKTMDNVISIDASQALEAVQQSMLSQLKQFLSAHAQID